MKAVRKISASSFNGFGNTFYLYQFVNKNGRATKLVCPLMDEHLPNGERNFQFVYPIDAIKHRDAPAALKSSFVNRIPASEVDFILEIDPN